MIINAWPRIAYHRGEVLRGLTICWCRIQEEDSLSEELREVEESVRRTLRLLTNVLRRDVDVEEEYRILIDGNDRLADLLVI